MGSNEYDGGGDNTGRVQVFQYVEASASWARAGQDLVGDTEKDEFGKFVALSGDGTVLVAGAVRNDLNGTDAGLARAFVYNVTTTSWEPLGQDLLGDAAGERFGGPIAVSADGEIVAIGAERHGQSRGRVRVFRFNKGSGRFDRLGQDLEGEYLDDNLGRALALSSDGMTLAAGGPQNDETGNNAGHVRVFQFNQNTGTWGQVGKDLDGLSAGDRFGIAVDLSAGGYRNDDNGDDAGHVRLFRYDNVSESWESLGQNLVGEESGDEFGRMVALSADGTVVGATSVQHRVNGSKDVGYARVFHFNDETSVWEPFGQALTGKKEGDELGWDLSLSADGSILAAGASPNNNEDSGYVQVYTQETDENR